MNLYNIFTQILILFLVLLAGIIVKRLKVVGDEFEKDLIRLIMNVTLPALIVSSMNFKFSPDMLIKSGKLLFICALIYIISILAAIVIPKLLKVQGPAKNVYRFMIVFSNVGFMGYPVIDAVYGQQGVFYAAIYNLPFNMLLWTVGLLIMSDGDEGKKIKLSTLLNPGTVAVIIGFIIFIFSLNVPKPIMATIDMIGSMTTALSMMLVGIVLAGSSIRKAFSSIMVFNISFVRLILLPLGLFLLFRPFISDPLILGIPIVIAAMPAATNTVIFAGMFDGDTYAASQSVFISTLLSIVTIPIVVYLIR